MRVTYYYDAPAPVVLDVTPPDGLDEDELLYWLEANAPTVKINHVFMESEG